MYIIGTVGPNVKDRIVLKGILDNGVNALRFNFAHGSETDFLGFLKMSKEIEKNIEIIVDLSGTKIRISDDFEYIFKIYNGEEVYFCGEDKYLQLKNTNKMKNKIIPLNIKNHMLIEKEYKQIGIKDNTMLFNILDSTEEMLKVVTVRGGIIRKGKGCNIKGLERRFLTLSDKDMSAVSWGITNKVDIICQSFVEHKDDILKVKAFINNKGLNESKPKIWAKIETLSGINNIGDILEEADGIVIGRGDLIPETSIEDTPIYEDIIIREVNKYKNKDIIIATHLFNSMKFGKMPSISEVESIYNFMKAGVTGFLLAGETSVGKAPVRTVKILKELICKYSK